RRNARLTRHLRPDQPDRPSFAQPAGDPVAHARRAAVAHGSVHEARGAEAASPFAPAAALDQEHVAEHRLGARDLGTGLGFVESREISSHHPRLEWTLVVDGSEGAFGVVAWSEAIGSIGARDVLGALEQGVAPGRTRGRAGEELRQHLLRLTDEEEI